MKIGVMLTYSVIAYSTRRDLDEGSVRAAASVVIGNLAKSSVGAAVPVKSQPA